MGLLLFQYNKLSYKRKMNENAFQQMLLTRHQDAVKSQIASVEQNKATMQGLWTMASNTIQESSSSVFTAQMQGNSQATAKLSKAYSDAIANNPTNPEAAEILEAKAALDNQKNESANMAKANFAEQMAVNQGLALSNSLFQSVFEAADKAKLTALQAEDQRIDIKMGGLKSEALTLKENYDANEKAEGQAAKDAAPSFGIG